MHFRFPRHVTALLAVVTSAGLTACADHANSTTAPISLAVGDATTSTPEYGKVKICKQSTSGTAGTFTVTRTSVGASTGTVSTPITIQPGACAIVVEDNGGTDVGSNVKIQETSAGFVSASAIGLFNPGGEQAISYTDNSTVIFVNSFHGAVVTYVNFIAPPPPPPVGGQGCSPGYWKNHDTWPAPYTPSTQFSAVFENAFPGLTLQQVLSLKGGDLNALGRQTVSALLNAKALGTNYELTPKQVIDAFNAVFPGGDYNTLKNKFEALTDVDGRICPLN